ncbi:dihydroorotate dehydrogenase electron transfer subunit [Muricomes intestini]|uniref:dihydroorotate dehydrogenase electron transfer subunit n=1 Tax=Muricomes intestini TaxID=1796634 RepID=UPI000E93872B|nr:dihydroorotate dehydrogenase electron transfer subunit [Lachnospiraceae bacterium]
MSGRRKESAVIISQEGIALDIYSMWIHTEKIAESAVPGQFISMYTKDGSKLLPRPISLCEIDRQKSGIRVVYRVTGTGTGTEQFAKLLSGDTIDILGPLGNGFPLDVTENTGKNTKDCRAMLIGGGIGVPPMLELAKQLNTEKIMVMGYRDQQFLRTEFQKQGSLYIATEDGSAGTKGNVMDAIEENGLSADIIYACGPAPMLHAIKRYAEEKSIVCYISMEEKMACGIGTCLACVCQSKEIDGHSHVHNKRVCKDGPVFLSTEVEI